MKTEWKIGEIGQVNGEWYQCLESSNCRCDYCDYGELGDCDNIACMSGERSDSKEIYLEKLEKVGKPFERNGYMYQEYKAHTYPLLMSGDAKIVTNNGFAVIIKQNKEDVEEKNLVEKLSEKVHNAWMKEKEAQGFSYGEEYSKEEKKHPDMLPYNKLKEEIKEYDRVTIRAVLQAQKELRSENNNLKSFNLQKAKQGKPVCTSNGKKARIICFDAKGVLPIIALVESGDEEKTVRYSNSGRFRFDGMPDEEDLMMVPEKKEGWINVYDADTTFRFVEGMVYNTKDEAIQRTKEEVANGQREKNEYVDTVKICWEE